MHATYPAPYTPIGASILPDTLYSYASAGRGRAGLGFAVGGCVVCCSERGDDVGVFVQREGRRRTFYVVVSRTCLQY